MADGGEIQDRASAVRVRYSWLAGSVGWVDDVHRWTRVSIPGIVSPGVSEGNSISACAPLVITSAGT
jgi:hypothetical protein